MLATIIVHSPIVPEQFMPNGACHSRRSSARVTRQSYSLNNPSQHERSQFFDQESALNDTNTRTYLLLHAELESPFELDHSASVTHELADGIQEEHAHLGGIHSRTRGAERSADIHDCGTRRRLARSIPTVSPRAALGRARPSPPPLGSRARGRPRRVTCQSSRVHLPPVRSLLRFCLRLARACVCTMCA